MQPYPHLPPTPDPAPWQTVGDPGWPEVFIDWPNVTPNTKATPTPTTAVFDHPPEPDDA